MRFRNSITCTELYAKLYKSGILNFSNKTRHLITCERIYVDWIDIVTWRHSADFLCKYFHKGDPVVIEGSIQSRMWEDKDGKKRKTIEVVADNVEFVPKAKGEALSAGKEEDFQLVESEDLPF